MGDLDPAFYECADCHKEAVFLHRYADVELSFCDKHSLRELRRDLHQMERTGIPILDFIEAVLIS